MLPDILKSFTISTLTSIGYCLFLMFARKVGESNGRSKWSNRLDWRIVQEDSTTEIDLPVNTCLAMICPYVVYSNSPIGKWEVAKQRLPNKTRSFEEARSQTSKLRYVQKELWSSDFSNTMVTSAIGRVSFQRASRSL